MFFQIINRFYYQKRFKFYFLILFSLLAGLFEYFGLVLIFQFTLFLNNPDSIYCKKIISIFQNYFRVYEFGKIGLILGIFTALIYIFKNIFMLFYTKFNNKILEDLSVQITLKTFKNLLYSPYIFTKNMTEADKLNILSKITIAVWQYCYKFINVITNSAIAVILMCFVFIKFTKIALAAFVLLSGLAAVEYFYLKFRSNIQKSLYNTAFENVNKILLTVINSIREIKINNKEEYFLEKSKKEYTKLASLNKDRNFNATVHVYFTEISVMIGFIAILIVLFYTTNFNNQILISSLCTICVVILRLTPALNRTQSALYSLNSTKPMVRDLIDFDKNFNYSDTISPKEKLPYNTSIRLENVCFSYFNNEEGLKNINLTVKKNDFIHIIGKSGSYKTTLALILSGLIKPQKGRILIDDNELFEYKKWCCNVAFLSQDFTFLFDKVEKVIDFENKKTSEYAAKLDLKDVKNKNINELSKGEQQRIALIDILLKDKSVIILDEATANIDISSQNKIMEILDSLKSVKTIISITHRLENIKEDDLTLFLYDGGFIFGTFKNVKQNENFNM